MYRNTFVEIDTDIIGNNIKNIINKYNEYKYYIGVVKGNAYGHGEYISRTIVENGINYLAVSSLEEGINVRKYVEEPILCLEPIDLKYIDECIKNNITITVSNYNYFKELISKNVNDLKIHLKLNTGMNRLGLNKKEEVTEIYNTLINNSDIKLEGIYTHMATNGVTDKIFDNQIDKFKELTENIDLSKIEIVHIGRSSTLEYHPKLDFVNGIRLGIAMYGIKQPSINYNGFKGFLRKLKHNHLIKKYHISKTYKHNDLEIKTAYKLKSEVIDIQSIKKGEIVGYGGKFKASGDTFIAVVPIGYSDGIDLKYTNVSVSINNKKYKIVGVVNMGMLTIEVDDSVKVGDTVTIIDNNIKKIAKDISVTPYVVMTAINRDVPRIYIKNGEKINVTE